MLYDLDAAAEEVDARNRETERLAFAQAKACAEDYHHTVPGRDRLMQCDDGGRWQRFDYRRLDLRQLDLHAGAGRDDLRLAVDGGLHQRTQDGVDRCGRGRCKLGRYRRHERLNIRSGDGPDSAIAESWVNVNAQML